DGLNLQSFKLVKQDFVSYVSKRITGIAKDSVSVYTALPVPEPPADWETAISKQKLPDTKYNAGLFMTSTGAVRYAADAANRDQVEIAVVYDKINGRIFLESPVRIRAYIDHSNTYNHPLHTVYQKTPSSFSETDFNNLKGSDL